MVGRVRQPEVGLGLSRESRPALFLRRLQASSASLFSPLSGLLGRRMLDEAEQRRVNRELGGQSRRREIPKMRSK